MSIQTELTRIINAKAAIKTAIEGKGVTVPDGTLLDGMAALIESIEAGGSGLGGDFEVSTGIITLAEDSTTIRWEHGLSKAPSFGMIFMLLGYNLKPYASLLRTFYKRYEYNSNISEKYDAYATYSSATTIKHPAGLGNSQSAFTVNDTTVIANECNFNQSNNTHWLSGKPYFWVCIAGDIVFPYE